MTNAMTQQRKRATYTAYKPSGLMWLEDVPSMWPISRLCFQVKINPVKSEIRGIPQDTSVSFVPMEAVGEYGGLRLEQTHALENVANGYTYFRDGDVVVAKITPCFENGKGSIADGLENGIGFGTTELHVLRPSSFMDRNYLFYLTISHAFRKIGASYMYGAGGQKRVPDTFIRDFRHPIPTTKEQRSIAAFLDRETARIDALIEKKQRQIELLQEKRSALISHAVTKGLAPKAPMKDSGIEWLGEIPAHWEVAPLRWHIKIASGDFLPNTSLEVVQSDGYSVPALGGNGLMGYTDKANVHGSCIVVGRVGAQCGNIHRVNSPSWVTDNALIVRIIKSFNEPFLGAVLDASNLNRLANQNAQPLITGLMVKSLIVSRPPEGAMGYRKIH